MLREPIIGRGRGRRALKPVLASYVPVEELAFCEGLPHSVGDLGGHIVIMIDRAADEGDFEHRIGFVVRECADECGRHA